MEAAKHYILVVIMTAALHPSLSSIVTGVDGPFRVLLFTFVVLAANNYHITIRPKQYRSLGLLALFIFFVLLLLAFANTAVNGRLTAGAISNICSYLLIFSMAIFMHHDRFEKLIIIIRKSLLLGGLFTALYIFYSAAIYHTFFVGLLRYQEEFREYNLNHFATYLGLVLVALSFRSLEHNSYMQARVAIFASYFAIGFAFVMLVSKTAIIAVLAVTIVALLWRHYMFIATMLLLGLSAMCFVILNLNKIYVNNYLIFDKLTSGRGRLWYYASNSGSYEIISSFYEADSVFIERTIESGHSTSYLHSSIVYFFLHTGVISTIVFYAIVVSVFWYNLKSRYVIKQSSLLMFIYLVVLGIGEQPAEFQKYGALMFFIFAYLLITRSSATVVSDSNKFIVPLSSTIKDHKALNYITKEM